MVSHCILARYFYREGVQGVKMCGNGVESVE